MEKKINKNTTSMSCIYWPSSIGFGIYFISVARGFYMGLRGILKALIWSVFLVLEAFSFF